MSEELNYIFKALSSFQVGDQVFLYDSVSVVNDPHQNAYKRTGSVLGTAVEPIPEGACVTLKNDVLRMSTEEEINKANIRKTREEIPEATAYYVGYGGYTHSWQNKEDKGIEDRVHHQVVDGMIKMDVTIIYGGSPMFCSHVLMSPDEAVSLATTLLRDAELAKWGTG